MRNTLMIVLLNCSLTAVSFAKSSVGDWQSVQQDIPRGWQITVVTSFTFPCVFQQANEQELVCRQLDRHREESDREEIHIRRDRIHEIRVERRDGSNMLAGAAGGGAAGAGLGAIAAAGSRGGPAFALALLGVSMGAHAGHSVHTLHGKVIYRRP